MPIYEYRCTQCGHKLETLQKFSDAPLTTCPACGKEALGKLVSAAGFQLKGSGWYQTDFRGSGKPKEKTGDSKDDAKADAAKDGAKSDGAKEGATADGATRSSSTESAASSASTSGGDKGSSSASSSTAPSTPAAS